MKTSYQVWVHEWDPVTKELVTHPYTGRIWDQEHELDAHDERWNAQHDEGIEYAWIKEVTA